MMELLPPGTINWSILYQTTDSYVVQCDFNWASPTGSSGGIVSKVVHIDKSKLRDIKIDELLNK